MIYPNQLIKKGSKNSIAVKAIKGRLNVLIGSTLDVTNSNFGDSTEAVVKQFQRKSQLIDDGIVGELTWDRLFTDYTEQPPSASTLALRAVEIADTQTFVREKTGRNDGKEVEGYLASIGLGKGYAWCAAFVYWCFDKASKDLGIANPVLRTGGVLRLWNETPIKHRVKTPQPGDIFIMDFGKGNGHTGIVSEVRGSKIYTVEGNTSADPTYAGADREGNGVFERVRNISSINKGFLRF